MLTYISINDLSSIKNFCINRQLSEVPNKWEHAFWKFVNPVHKLSQWNISYNEAKEITEANIFKKLIRHQSTHQIVQKVAGNSIVFSYTEESSQISKHHMPSDEH